MKSEKESFSSSPPGGKLKIPKQKHFSHHHSRRSDKCQEDRSCSVRRFLSSGSVGRLLVTTLQSCAISLILTAAGNEGKLSVQSSSLISPTIYSLSLYLYTLKQHLFKCTYGSVFQFFTDRF